jgi:hypothetical protein
VKPAPSKAISLREGGTNTIFTVMAFKEVYDCEILISEIEKVLLSIPLYLGGNVFTRADGRLVVWLLFLPIL